MSTQKSRRLTVRVHNIQFLEKIAYQMGITNLSEALNYILLDCKGLGYSFGNKPQPQPLVQAPIGFDPGTFEITVPAQENIQNAVDPVIERLIAAGLEMDF